MATTVHVDLPVKAVLRILNDRRKSNPPGDRAHAIKKSADSGDARKTRAICRKLSMSGSVRMVFDNSV